VTVSSSPSGINSKSHSAVRKMTSREKVDGNTSGSSSPLPSGAAAAATPSSPDGKAAAAVEADAGAVLKGFAHAVCLIDDPSTKVFRHLLAKLHSLQVQLLVLAASMGQGSSSSEQEEAEPTADSMMKLQLPHATNLQVLAIANLWLQQHAGSGAAAAAAGRQFKHQALLPLPGVALEALHDTGMDSLAAVQQLVRLCAKALQADCFRFVMLRQQQMQQQQQQAAGEGSSSSGSSSTAAAAAAAANRADTVEVYNLVLDAVCLQQACGVAASESTLSAVAFAARCSMRAEVLQLLQQRGGELLRALLQYVQQDTARKQEEGSAVADEAAAEERDMRVAQHCVICANVFMDICSRGRSGVGKYHPPRC
jgi:hypothetical protein